tara:strand:+ start:307 stop:633 length:327 start_codon:yes stop_codon:yes gene_type:complete
MKVALDARLALQPPRDVDAAAFPMHKPKDVLEKALKGIGDATGLDVPGFTFDSDPVEVYRWIISACTKLYNEGRKEGVAAERMDAPPRINPGVAQELMKLLSRANEVL